MNQEKTTKQINNPKKRFKGAAAELSPNTLFDAGRTQSNRLYSSHSHDWWCPSLSECYRDRSALSGGMMTSETDLFLL